jgi:L-gulonolactone oxidase
LTGSIPSSVGILPALEGLFLADNRLSGSLPASLGQLSGLVNLDFSNNELDGDLPSELGNLSSLVCAARLVTGTGDVLELAEGDPRLNGVRLGRGALGIRTALTLRCERQFQLREVVTPMPFGQVVDALPELARSSEYVKIWWLPPSETAHVFRYERTEARGKRYAMSRWIDTHVVNRVVFPGLLGLGRRVPRAVGPINALTSRVYLRPRTRTGRAADMLTLAMPPRHRELEYGVPLARASAALERVRAQIERLRVGVNFIQELRFVPKDSTWLSPAYGRDSCQVGVYMANAPGINQLFTSCEHALQELEGRPHFGKEHRASPATLRARFPRFDDFLALRAELDPRGVLRNAFVDRALLGEPCLVT